MKTPRWLLPFTFGVDMRAIEYAVSLAQSAGAALVLVRLPAHTGFTPPLGTRFLSWLRRLREQQETTWQAQGTRVIEEPLWIRTEQRHIG